MSQQQERATLKKNVFVQKAKKHERKRSQKKQKKRKKNRRKKHETGKKKQTEEFRIFFCAFSATCDTINFAAKNGSSLRKNRT